MMDKNAKIFVAGHRGLVGSAIAKKLIEQGFQNLILKSHHELDLTDEAATKAFFKSEKPEYVILAAAKVGGIYANNTYPVDFLLQNLKIQNNVIQFSFEAKAKRLLFLGSSCIYPKLAPQPLKEEYLLTGELEPTNRPYALAKIAGIELCWSYNRQFGTQYLAAMPTNIYGPGDNYDLKNSHVLPALIRKFHEAKIGGAKSVEVWGTGAPRREFLYSEDLAEACVFLMNLTESQFSELTSAKNCPLINIGTGQDLTIRELAEIVKKAVGYEGNLEFDRSKPDGVPQKLLDISRIKSLGWEAKTTLKDGVIKAFADYKQQ
jgi:GDP-L-fucose synthase